MTYKILLTNRAIKDLQHLTSQAQHRIKDKLSDLTSELLKDSIKLTNPIIGTYRIRIGDYRVIFDIDGSNVVILRIGHRKDIYRK